MKHCLPLLAIMVSIPVVGQRLEQDQGVELRGSIAIEAYAAGECIAHEAVHSTEEYERIRGNHGKPMDIYRAEFSVYNGSGRTLEFLSATYTVESRPPGCTRWANGGYSQALWFSVHGSIFARAQPYAMAPGDTRTETHHIIVLAGDPPPRFSDWWYTFDFADDSPLQITPLPEESGARDGSDSPVAPSSPQGEPASAQSWRPGESFSDALTAGGWGPEMVVIPAGRFRMGCLSRRGCRNFQTPIVEVAIPDEFAVSNHEVTFEQWDACAAGGGCGGYRPDDMGWGRASRPVVNVAWEQARAYVTWLSWQTGHHYRLLSESEWEYVARAGSETVYSWGNDIGTGRANCWSDSCGEQWEFTAPVGSFPANPFGVHDMHGNAGEWVEDCWDETYSGAPPDGSPRQNVDCQFRLLLGGTWEDSAEFLRAAMGQRIRSGVLHSRTGFRVARTLNATGLSSEEAR